MSFFTSGKVDVSRYDRNKLPAGVKGPAVYRVRLTDAADHFGGNSGDRTQFNFKVIGGPLDGRTGAELIMHSGYKERYMEAKARGTIAITLGAFMGFDADRSGFKVTSEVFLEQTRKQFYNGNTVSEKSREASDLPLVQAEAEAFLVVKPYFDKKTGQRKVNPKTKQLSVTYEFFPLSANLTISDKVESHNSDDEDTDEAPAVDEPEVETTQVDALALALADGWKPNGTTGYFYNSKDKTAKQLKEPALRAAYTK